MLLIVALVVLAVVGGLYANRILIAAAHKRGESSDAEGLSITDIAGIIPTMSVLLLAFIMVATYDSWQTAGTVAGDESNAALSIARTARFLPNERGAEITRDMLCYARSVEHQEWPAMADRRASNVPEYWGDKVNNAIDDARTGSSDVTLDLVSLERDRLQARQVRLAESLPSVPGTMTALMVLSVVLSVFFLGMLTHASIRTPVQIAALVGATVLLTGSLLLIAEMDSPYSGPTEVAPGAMHHTEHEIVDELADYTTREPAPCDAKGLPLQDGSFHPGRESIT